MDIIVIGGGPSGLYFSLLMKERFPRARVRVFEQNPKGATYGFGIVLADRGLKRFFDAHPASYRAIMESSFVSRHRLVGHPGERIFIEGGGYGGAISRLRLLEILESFCAKAGVELFFESRIESDVEFGDADLVVGADGVNSMVRRNSQEQFGTSTVWLSNRLAWYGTHRHFPYPILSFRKHDGGFFVAAAYAYTERMGTFVAECDSATWEKSGLDRMTEEEQRRYTEAVFAPELGACPLISNKSQYRPLPVVRNREWFVGNRVLIGDALHSAHPTIGSGTRIAMEDAVALAEALAATDGDIQGALTLFRSSREPQKAKLVLASEKSFQWYESFPEKMEQLGAVEFVFDFLMRTGRVGYERLQSEYPAFIERYGHRFTGSKDVKMRDATSA